MRFAAAILGVLAFGSVASAQTLPGLDPHKLVVAQFERVASDKPNARLQVGDCALVNNVWDPPHTPAGFAQTIFAENRDGKMLPGWTWKAAGTAVLSMPEIVCGDKPWDAPQVLRADFPFPAGEKAPLIRFDIDLKADGIYNMAFSLWAESKLPAVQKNIALEIMVWNVAHGQAPTGEKIGAVEAAGTTFDLWLKKDQGMVTGPDPFTWPLVQFVARTPVLKGELDTRPFLDELMRRGLLARGAYLTSVELGNEVTQGRGEVSLRAFEVIVR